MALGSNSHSTTKRPPSVGGGILPEPHLAQLQVLKLLAEANPSAHEGNCLNVDEICGQTKGIDDKETLRCLYILEGRKLVSPSPKGDLTSKLWHVTQVGVTASRKLGL